MFFTLKYSTSQKGMRMTEAETRASLVDKRLLASGWDVSDHTKVVEEFTLNGNPSVKDASSPQSKVGDAVQT